MAAGPSYYRVLRAHFAPRLDLERWWPGRTRFAVITGAILVQHTAWSNVLPALARLRAAGALSPAGVRRLGPRGLEPLIRCAGCWRAKARYLYGFADWLERRHGGSLARLFAQPTATVRAELLSLPGIGPETADAILLYAGAHPTFIVDAYTRRIFLRHGLQPAGATPSGRHGDYERWREWLHADWPDSSRTLNARRYREFHALLVETAKRYCRLRQPDCAACPLRVFLPAAPPAP